MVKYPRAPWRFDIPYTKGTIVRYSDNLILVEHCHASNVIGMAWKGICALVTAQVPKSYLELVMGPSRRGHGLPPIEHKHIPMIALKLFMGPKLIQKFELMPLAHIPRFDLEIITARIQHPLPVMR